ncbi:glycosyltransferase [Mycoplasmatota bacterium]|nr:glycosyltransferase [Mycoplasmatota bacterium]
MKTVSIICPVYNSEDYLSQLIKSIIDQSYPNFECIFVDDASTDKSCEIINSIVDKRFILEQNESNQGAQVCRKRGFESCHGEYVVFIDSDDYLDVNYLKNLLLKLEQDQSEIVMCNYEVINQNNKLLRKNNEVTPIPKNQFPLYAKTHKEVIMSKPAFWNKMFTHTFLLKYLSFPNVTVAQDLSIVPLLLSKAKISYVDEVLYYYRVIDKSISNTYDRRLLDIHKSFLHLKSLKKEYYFELEFMAIGHYFYQMSKALFIKDKDLRLSVYCELMHNLKCEFQSFKKNPYYKKRLDYRVYIFILSQKIIFSNPIIHSLVSSITRIKIINKWIRKSDK